MAAASVDTTSKPFWPIEFFLSDIVKSKSMITWVMDQVGVLRSVFELNKWDCSENTNSKTILSQNQASVRINYGKDRFFVKSKQAVSTDLYRKSDDPHKVMAACLHLNDGTALMFMRFDDWLYCYHFCFEESGDWTVLVDNSNSEEEYIEENSVRSNTKGKLKSD